MYNDDDDDDGGGGVTAEMRLVTLWRGAYLAHFTGPGQRHR